KLGRKRSDLLGGPSVGGPPLCRGKSSQAAGQKSTEKYSATDRKVAHPTRFPWQLENWRSRARKANEKGAGRSRAPSPKQVVSYCCKGLCEREPSDFRGNDL